MYQVLIEGQMIPLPPGVEKDEDIKRAITPFFPEVASALLTRKTEGDVTTITVVKKAGSKGLANLVACPGGKNPAIALYEKIEQLGPQPDIVELLALEDQISSALTEGEEQRRKITKAAGRLSDTVALPAPVLVMGF
jgi:hypothetical protein